MAHNTELTHEERVGKKWECPICNDLFIDSRLIPHTQFCEYKVNQMTKGCTICGKSFAREKWNNKIEVQHSFTTFQVRTV